MRNPPQNTWPQLVTIGRVSGCKHTEQFSRLCGCDVSDLRSSISVAISNRHCGYDVLLVVVVVDSWPFKGFDSLLGQSQPFEVDQAAIG